MSELEKLYAQYQPRRYSEGGLNMSNPDNFYSQPKVQAQTPPPPVPPPAVGTRVYGNGNGLTGPEIAAYVAQNINNPQEIYNSAKKYQLSNQDIADATGYSLDQVNNYMNQVSPPITLPPPPANPQVDAPVQYLNPPPINPPSEYIQPTEIWPAYPPEWYANNPSPLTALRNVPHPDGIKYHARTVQGPRTGQTQVVLPSVGIGYHPATGQGQGLLPPPYELKPNY